MQAQILNTGWPTSRVVLPLLHAAIALALLSYLYLPHWRDIRKREVAMQLEIEAEARAGRWPRQGDIGFEACYFGHPRPITAMYPANLPALFVAGSLVVPSNVQAHLLEQAPGCILPSTRLLVFIVVFSMVVALQWYGIVRILGKDRISPLWRGFIYVAPITLIPVDLVLRAGWADLFPLVGLSFWIFLVVGTVTQYRYNRPRAQRPPD